MMGMKIGTLLTTAFLKVKIKFAQSKAILDDSLITVDTTSLDQQLVFSLK